MPVKTRTEAYLTENRVKTPSEALLYITDCNLATVSSMAMLKSKSKSEFERQILIAQKAVDWILLMNIPIDVNSRVYDILSTGMPVSVWAEKHK